MNRHFFASCDKTASAFVLLLLFAPVVTWAGLPQPVPVVVAQSRQVTADFELDGIVEPVKQSTLSAQASGHVLVLHVHAGERIRSGQLLAILDDRDAAAGVARGQAQLGATDADLRNAKNHLARTRELHSQGFVSKAALDTAELQWRSAAAGNDQARAGLRQSALVQGYARVYAPYDGWVLETHVQAGDLALPGKPLLTVYAPQPLRAVVQVPLSRAALARQASQIGVRPTQDQLRSEWLKPAAVSSMPSADPVSQTIEWRFELGAADAARLLPGSQVRVRFGGQAVQGARRVLLPAGAILRRGELTAVYVATEKGFALRAVRLGADHGAEGVELLAGLQDGERVALDPVRAGLLGATAAPSR